ncbi:hypothetical protein Hypma_009482 [Hypsizygus marmoreus]|uniref:DEAD/DEAH-box helicase domain-containing protein n=1 Tax=Hypsizygus marmoreus TaxID=39966 RepID=A0A369JRF5_HYPMA|nr:hypothetical protein Hypma_009482 [Hypsizygus marmoreus]
MGCLPFEPHNYLLEGIGKSLDGVDLAAVTPTGSGKTGFFYMFILVIMAINSNPSLCPSAKFPEDPVLIVICPTNYVENQMAKNMPNLSISALAINALTVASARIEGGNLWEEAKSKI